MKFDAEAVIKPVTHVLGIAIAWYALSALNAWLFAGLEHTSRAHWIFLPAAFRPLIVLMFGRVGAVGLVLGAYLTVYGTADGDAFHEMIFSVILGITPWIAVSLGKWALNIPRTLAGLGAWHIVMLCTLCASANAVALNGYLWASGRFEGGLIQIVTVFVGDLVGAALVLFLVANVLAFVMPRRSSM